MPRKPSGQYISRLIRRARKVPEAELMEFIRKETFVASCYAGPEVIEDIRDLWAQQQGRPSPFEILHLDEAWGLARWTHGTITHDPHRISRNRDKLIQTAVSWLEFKEETLTGEEE